MVVGPTVTGKKEEKKKAKTLTPSEDVIQQAKNLQTGASDGKERTLVGLKKGEKIRIGQQTSKTPKDRPFSPEPVTPVYSEATWVKGDAEKLFANKGNQEKAELLLRMGQIPNLYTSGQAPTPEYITRSLASGMITPRPEDIAAFEKVLAVNDLRGDSTPEFTVLTLSSNPTLSAQYFGKVTPKPKAVTSSAALEAEMNAKFLDLFDSPVDKKTAKEYAKEINALELSGQDSPQQKEDVFLKYVQKKANQVYELSSTGMAPGILDKGGLGRVVRNIRATYADNGIPVNEKEVYNQAIKSLRSEDAYRNVLNDINMHASLVMPAFKDLYAQGKTSRVILAPWISLRSKILGIPEDQVKIEDMYSIGAGDKPIPLDQYKKQLYASEEFKGTDTYKQRSLGDLRTMITGLGILK